MKRLLFILAALLAPVAAHAQNAACPSVAQNQVWTTQQWNTCLASIPNTSSGTLTNPAITGGTISGVAITGSTIVSSTGPGTIVSVITATGSIVPGPVLSETIVVNKTTPAASSVVLPASSNWPSCPSATATVCPVYTIKDGAGNAASNHITVTTADSKNIDGAASNVISTNYGAMSYVLNGTQWNAIP